MGSNRYRELKKNTIIIAIANLGSKAISFILAPLYSYYLTTSQYGTMDLITTTVSLLGPLLCLDIYEATFRFSSDDSYPKEKVFVNSIIVSFPSLLLLCLFSLITFFVSKSPQILIFTGAFMYLDSITQIFSQYMRGRGDLKEFAISGIINSIFLLLSDLFFLVLLKQQLFGWMLSFLIGKLAMLVFGIIKSRVLFVFSLKLFDVSCIKKMIVYCIPLLPTAMMWWIMNASDRYMLTFFVGTGITGIYAVANKLPSLLSVFERIFYQSFQTSGINDMNNNDRDIFYTNVFNGYFSILSIGILFLLIILKPITIFLFAKEYESAWICTSILTVSILCHALCGNLGSYYVIFKKTRGALLTSSVGALTNVLLNCLFIPLWGMLGAAVTTLVGYTVALVVRWFDVKKFVTIKIDTKRFIVNSSMIVCQIILYYIPGYISLFARIIIFALIAFIERKTIIRLFQK